MLRPLRSLNHSSIKAIDGDLGKVQDIYFDDKTWTVRYLVVRAGSWLVGRDVLISPHAVRRVDWDHHVVELSLSCDQIRNSPDIDMDKPVSRQKEIQFFDYYRWPYYWTGAGIWGIGPYPAALGDRPIAAPESELDRAMAANDKILGKQPEEIGDPHLRSCREIEGYRIAAADCDFGHIESEIMDERTWSIQYLVVRTKNFLPSKLVLMSSDWVDSISWSDRSIQVHRNSEIIKNNPEYNPDKPISP